MRFASKLIAAIGGCAIVWYAICLIYLGFLSPRVSTETANTFREFMSLSVSTISGTLATYVGMILGVKTVDKAPKTNAVAAVLQTKSTPVNWLQGIAAVAYVASLIIALFAWWLHQQDLDPTIVALGKSFLGLLGGSLAVILNTNVSD